MAISRVRPTRVVDTRLDLARQEAQGLVVEVKKRRQRIADDFYEIGVALRKLARPRMYRALGYATFEELVTGRRLCSRVQAFKLMQVAAAFPKKQALELGVEKAYALVRYVEATPAADVARELAARDARVAGKPIAAITVSELREATRAVRGRDHAAADPAASAEARRVARRVQRELRARGLKELKARAVPKGARWVLTVELPLDDADALLGGRGGLE